MKKTIERIIEESIRIKKETFDGYSEIIVCIIQEIEEALKKGGKILLFGNGGSAADSQHVAAELIGRFKKNRRALAAIALTTDTSILTSLSNDYGFDTVFSRQLDGLAKSGDVVWVFSTSGNSKNVIDAVKKAREMGLKIISFTGCEGGQLAPLCDLNLIVPSNDTARIQEVHICFAHVICELLERNLTT